MTRRAGLTLVEVLMAAGILGALLVPVIVMFLFSTSGVGLDVDEIRAAALAEEIMEQVAAIHRLAGRLPEVPAATGEAGATGSELDLDAAMGNPPGDLDLAMKGLPLSQDKCFALRQAWIYPSPHINGLHRYLSIHPEKSLPSTAALTARVLWRVEVTVGAASGRVTRGRTVHLRSYFHEDRTDRRVP